MHRAAAGLAGVLIFTHIGAVQAEIPAGWMDKATLENLTQEIVFKIAGAKICDLGSLLPQDDINTIFKFVQSIDPEVFVAGTAKGTMMARGLPLQHKDIVCEVAEKKIRDALPLWSEIAKTLRDNGYK